MTEDDAIARAQRQAERCHWLDAVLTAELVTSTALIALALASYAWPSLLRAAVAAIGCWVAVRILRGVLLYRARCEHDALRRYVERHLDRRRKP